MMGVAEQNPKVTEGSGSDQRLIPIQKYGKSLKNYPPFYLHLN